MKIYINGKRASRADIATLLRWISEGKTTATATRTKAGAISIKTTD